MWVWQNDDFFANFGVGLLVPPCNSLLVGHTYHKEKTFLPTESLIGYMCTFSMFVRTDKNPTMYVLRTFFNRGIQSISVVRSFSLSCYFFLAKLNTNINWPKQATSTTKMRAGGTSTAWWNPWGGERQAAKTWRNMKKILAQRYCSLLVWFHLPETQFLLF